MNSFWLLKTEPEDYSWNDLIQEKGAVWDGVKAPAAVKNMQQMKPGGPGFHIPYRQRTQNRRNC